MTAERFFIDGKPIQAGLTYIEFQGIGGMFTTAGLRGANFAPPGLDGERWRQKARTVALVSLRFALVADRAGEYGEADLNAEWESLLRLFPRRRTVTVARDVSVMTESGIVTTRQEAIAEMVDSIAPSFLTRTARRGSLTLKLLDGAWFGATRRFTVVPGRSSFLPVGGTTDTKQLVVKMRGGSGVQVLRNQSTGVQLSYDWSTLTGAQLTSEIIIDVQKFTVLRAQPGNAVLSSLTRFAHAGDDYFMLLDPDLGDNELTLSSGTATVEWKDAYQ